jgi:hypothetical protein
MSPKSKPPKPRTKVDEAKGKVDSPALTKPKDPAKPVKSAELLKKLMLELFYPAVLGALLYELLNFGKDLVTMKQSFEWPTIVKLSLFLISIAFYICDYIYIICTKVYRGLFFLADIVFLLTLYATVKLLNLEPEVETHLPHNKLILLCYLIFLLAYLWWDSSELKRSSPGKVENYFSSVVRWEIRSSLAIIVLLIIAKLWWSNHFWISITTILFLLVITAWFWKLILRRIREDV